jgi:lysozyme
MAQSLSPSPACLSIIKEFEGVRLKAYPDPATKGPPITIGVGHTGPEVRLGLVWTEAQVDAALKADLLRFTVSLRALLGAAKTTQHQFDAMLSLAFNIGPGNFAKSSVLKNHIAGKYAAAAAAFALWNKAAGKVMPGLTRRRAAEAALYARA